jgi:hypothetical protein
MMVVNPDSVTAITEENSGRSSASNSNHMSGTTSNGSGATPGPQSTGGSQPVTPGRLRGEAVGFRSIGTTDRARRFDEPMGRLSAGRARPTAARRRGAPPSHYSCGALHSPRIECGDWLRREREQTLGDSALGQ